MDIDNITSLKKKNPKHTHIILFFFFMFVAKKSPEIFLKHKGHFFISESFALN